MDPPPLNINSPASVGAAVGAVGAVGALSAVGASIAASGINNSAVTPPPINTSPQIQPNYPS